jgi:hypothetical protein
LDLGKVDKLTLTVALAQKVAQYEPQLANHNNIYKYRQKKNALKTRLKILPVLTREHYTSLLHWV